LKSLLLLVLLIGCSKPLLWTKEQLYVKGFKKDASLKFVLPSKMNEGVTCAEYGDGCVGAHIVSVRNLEMIAVEFLDEKSAVSASKRLRGYHSRNWLFDDVTGEPLLEKFVVDALEAKKFSEDSLEKNEPLKPE